MKFDGNTLAILENFASINQGVVLKPGNEQRTMSFPDKSIFVEACNLQDFPVEFGIYDLNQFLGNLKTLKNPELTFASDHVIMDDGEMSLTYYACPANLIATPPADKKITLKSIDVTFTLTHQSLQKLLRMARMNNLPHLSVIGKNGELLMKIHESTNDTSNFGSIKLGDYAGKDFVATFKTENLKMLPMDYQVSIQIGAFAQFYNSCGLTYYIGLETQ
jgi:hypothetical protein